MNRATQRSHHSVNYSENVARVIESLRWWRVPEFVGLAMILAAVLLVEESASEYKRYIPSVRTTSFLTLPVISRWAVVVGSKESGLITDV